MQKRRKPHIPNFAELSKTVRKSVIDAVDKKIMEFMREERAAFKARIVAQDFPSFKQPPLSDAHAARKARLGLSPLTMVATGQYLKSIKVYKQDDPHNKDAKQYVISIAPGARARDMETRKLRDDVFLQEVALVQEYGSQKHNIPPRPHWRPQMEELRKHAVTLRRELSQMIADAAKNKSRRKK